MTIDNAAAGQRSVCLRRIVSDFLPESFGSESLHQLTSGPLDYADKTQHRQRNNIEPPGWCAVVVEILPVFLKR